MNKILAFVVNECNEILLLKGSDEDPQFKKSFWYVITGGCEDVDRSIANTVNREVKEETGLTVKNKMYLNWIFKYESLGIECIEYVYISFVDKKDIILNEESVDYKWCKLEEFIEATHWFSNKKILRKVLELALDKKLYFRSENIEEL